MTGAAVLAARAALAAGAGRVYLGLLAAHDALPFDAAQPELMGRARARSCSHADVLAQSTVVCGCGGGDAMRAALPPSATMHAAAGARRRRAERDRRRRRACSAALRARAARGLRHRADAASARSGAAAAARPRPTCRPTACARPAPLADGFALHRAAQGFGQRGRARRAHAAHQPDRQRARWPRAGSGDVLAGWIGGWWAQRRRRRGPPRDRGRGLAARRGRRARRRSRGPLRASRPDRARCNARATRCATRAA